MQELYNSATDAYVWRFIEILKPFRQRIKKTTKIYSHKDTTSELQSPKQKQNVRALSL